MRSVGSSIAALVASTAATAPAQPRQSRELVQTAVAAGQFKTLAARLLTRAGLVGALEKPGPYTVFAPTDAAFAKLPKKTVETKAFLGVVSGRCRSGPGWPSSLVLPTSPQGLCAEAAPTAGIPVRHQPVRDEE